MVFWEECLIFMERPIFPTPALFSRERMFILLPSKYAPYLRIQTSKDTHVSRSEKEREPIRTGKEKRRESFGQRETVHRIEIERGGGPAVGAKQDQ